MGRKNKSKIENVKQYGSIINNRQNTIMTMNENGLNMNKP